MTKLLFTWSILAFVLAANVSAVPKCAVRCNMYVEEPVCAQNADQLKVFKNNCLLLTANCNDDVDWKITPLSNCMQVLSEKKPSKRCNFNCNAERLPVCGFLDNTYEEFDNECLLREQKCKDGGHWIEHPMSHCTDTVETKQRTKRSVECPAICPMNYDPICAVDGRSNRVFANECEMAAANCNTNKWMRARSTECDQEAMYGFGQVGVENDDFDCPESCDYTASYVCGFNGEKYRIFGNECTLKLTRCRSKQSWNLKPFNECDGKDDWYFPIV